MTTILSPQLIGGDDENQHKRSDPTTSFVIDRPYSGPGRTNNNPRLATNGAHNSATDPEPNINLFEHLASDLANLLNRTDISDCFLNVQGTFMAVHKCILAARSNAFAGKVAKGFLRCFRDENFVFVLF